MALISTFHGKARAGEKQELGKSKSWGTALPFLNLIIIFTVSEQIFGILPTDSLGLGNQFPCVWMGWGRAGVCSKVPLSAKAPSFPSP